MASSKIRANFMPIKTIRRLNLAIFNSHVMETDYVTVVARHAARVIHSFVLGHIGLFAARQDFLSGHTIRKNFITIATTF